MSDFRTAVMTDAGADLLATSISEGFQLEFVKMITGSGNYSEDERKTDALGQRVALKEQRQEFGFSSIAAKDNAVCLKALLTNEKLASGYRMTEIGIIARKSGEENEGILYSIAIAAEADYMPDKSSPIEIVQEYYTKVSNAENATINVEIGAYALAGDLLDEVSRATAAEAELQSAKHMHENKSLLDRISVVNNTADKDKIVAGVAVDGGEASPASSLPRPVWITSSASGALTEKRTYSSDFTYVPSTHTLNVKNVNGTAASATNADTVDGKHASELQNYNNLTNKPTIPSAVDGVNFNGKSEIVHYGVCNTEGNKAEKTVSLPGFTLTNGARITVWFKNENTATGHTTLNVNGTGAKEILHEFTYANNFLIRQNGVYEFVYSGSYWMFVGHIVWVKGAAESSYRTGKVNLTAENVGALPISGGTMEGNADIIMNGGTIASSGNILTFSSKTTSDTTTRAFITTTGDGGSFSMLYHIGTTFMGNHCDLGTNDRKWRNIYAANGTIQTSDRTKKYDITEIPEEIATAIVMGVLPSSYKMVDGTSGRTHYGIIAQDVEELLKSLGMDTKDFAGFIKSPKVIRKDTDEEGNPLKEPIEEVVEGEYDYALRYDEFIAPIIKTVQSQQREIKKLKGELRILKKHIEEKCNQ